MSKKNGQNQIKVLVVGSGGREHALVWKLNQSRKLSKIFCAPGNAGIATMAKCVNIKADNVKGLAEFAQRSQIGLTIVGPEQPLANGIVDEFQRRKLKIFGPDRKGAQLESSKLFAKQFMQKYHIPTAPFKSFTSVAEAIGFCRSLQYPAVIKADGLAAGKGVEIVHSVEEATATIEQMMVNKAFGKSGATIIIESFLQGQEVSVMAITDGKTIVPLLPSQDHKQAFDGDTGPNTGGMGAYCPTSFVTPELMTDIYDHVLAPTVAGLRLEKITYKGVLYAGLMITDQGPKVLEFNCRFGDPETQAVLPLLGTDIVELFTRTVNKKLNGMKPLKWQDGAAACVIMASKGYPGKYKTGLPIKGLDGRATNEVLVLHAGTRRDGDRWLTSGGRVLGVVGIDKNLRSALDRAYSSVRRISFNGAYYRKDIGFRVLNLKKGQN